jgi:hypothetical protein
MSSSAMRWSAIVREHLHVPHSRQGKPAAVREIYFNPLQVRVSAGEINLTAAKIPLTADTTIAVHARRPSLAGPVAVVVLGVMVVGLGAVLRTESVGLVLAGLTLICFGTYWMKDRRTRSKIVISAPNRTACLVCSEEAQVPVFVDQVRFAIRDLRTRRPARPCQPEPRPPIPAIVLAHYSKNARTGPGMGRRV